MIKQILEKLRNKKEREKEYENDIRIQTKVHAKLKTPEERELEEYMEEERQKKIKEQVKMFRQKKKDEAFNPTSILKAPNMFKEENYKSMLDQKNIFKDCPSILTKSKNDLLK